MHVCIYFTCICMYIIYIMCMYNVGLCAGTSKWVCIHNMKGYRLYLSLYICDGRCGLYSVLASWPINISISINISFRVKLAWPYHMIA